MDVTKLPFNRFIGLKTSDKGGYSLMLENLPEYRNHLDTVHASALFALAEATSGYFLLSELSELTEYIDAGFDKGYADGEWEYYKNNLLSELKNYSKGYLNGLKISYYGDEQRLFDMKPYLDFGPAFCTLKRPFHVQICKGLF